MNNQQKLKRKQKQKNFNIKEIRITPQYWEAQITRHRNEVEIMRLKIHTTNKSKHSSNNILMC